LLAIEEADRGMEIAALVMSAAADEGMDDRPVHRVLAQLLLKTVGNYAGLSAEERNEFAKIPAWLNEIVDASIAGYQGTPGDIASLIRALGFHLASEMLGDREYSLLDMIIRRENKGIGFDRYLREKAVPVAIQGHKYHPWCWVVIHSECDRSAAEAQHRDYALTALNMAVRYCRESDQQMLTWAKEGFATFVELQQRLFKEIFSECLEMSASCNTSSKVLLPK